MKKRLIVQCSLVIIAILASTTGCKNKVTKIETLESEISVLREENKRLSKKITEQNNSSEKNEIEEYINKKFPIDGKKYKIKDQSITLYEDLECSVIAGYDELQIISPTVDTVELQPPKRGITFAIRVIVDGKPGFLFSYLYPVLAEE